jgi:CheY-like chemotaxis protein/HPt (histidine-containing phosphotransfer) domain-containing protein
MKGRIDVRSSLGEGSEFCVTLPLRVAADTAFEACAGGAPEQLRLLVVDDNGTSRDFLNKTIAACGWQADSVASGALALGQIAAGAAYDAVLADWQMPELDGLATMAALRAVRPALPVLIMVSAFGCNKLMREPDTAEADAILIKPVTAASLSDTLHQVLARRAGTPSQPGAGAPRTRIDGVRLLLVEDNMLNQIVARGMLEQAGAKVDAVNDGRQAVELLRNAPGRYDLVLMDAQMPVLDGLGATRLIRDELGLSLPVLAMTAGVLASERERCIASGMDDFVSKPVDVDQMLAVIARHLPQSRDAAPAKAMPEIAAAIRSGEGVFAPDQIFDANAEPAFRRTLLELIGKVIERAPDQLRQSRAAWAAGRIDEATHLLHTMRGSVGTLGAARFASATQELEAAVRANQASDSVQVVLLFEAVQRELEATAAAARQWLALQDG